MSLKLQLLSQCLLSRVVEVVSKISFEWYRYGNTVPLLTPQRDLFNKKPASYKAGNKIHETFKQKRELHDLPNLSSS